MCSSDSPSPKASQRTIRFSQECLEGVVPITFYSISYYANWILEATCALTENDEFGLCPDLICPPDDGVLGYPWAEVPDATRGIKTFRGFQPERVGQSPPAGTLFNTTTKVLVLGVDAPDRVALCFWTLTFPIIEFLGEDYEEIPSGTYEMDGWFFSDMRFNGLAVRMTARLDRNLLGNATLEVKAGHNESLFLSTNVSEDELWFQTPFDPNEFAINLIVTGLERENYLVLEFYGQTTHWYV